MMHRFVKLAVLAVAAIALSACAIKVDPAAVPFDSGVEAKQSGRAKVQFAVRGAERFKGGFRMGPMACSAHRYSYDFSGWAADKSKEVAALRFNLSNVPSASSIGLTYSNFSVSMDCQDKDGNLVWECTAKADIASRLELTKVDGTKSKTAQVWQGNAEGSSLNACGLAAETVEQAVTRAMEKTLRDMVQRAEGHFGQ